MRLRHIEMFQAIQQAGTLTGAAHLLGISQPAASKLLQQAEREAGFPLFTREKGRLQLSPQSALLREHIDRIADQMRDLQRLSDNVRTSELAPLRVAATLTLASALLPDAITRFHRELPEVGMDLLAMHSREMLDYLLLRDIDIGLTLQEVNHPGLQMEIIGQGWLQVIAPPGWWSEEQLQTPQQLSALAGAPMIGITVKDDLGRRIHIHLESLSPEPNIQMWVQTYQLARALVRDGHGLALVDSFTARGHGNDALQFRTLEPVLPIPLYAVYRKGEPLDHAQNRFLAHVREHASLADQTDHAEHGERQHRADPAGPALTR